MVQKPYKYKPPFRLDRAGSYWIIVDSAGMNVVRLGSGLYRVFETEQEARDLATSRNVPLPEYAPV